MPLKGILAQCATSSAQLTSQLAATPPSVVFVLIFEIFSNVSVDCVGCALFFDGVYGLHSARHL